ncbi:hypothetical protein DENSPDRAFT_836969 [Dentipellis sp. KUC8613]|nr:hypothetical protein DENSPDRAFT_836969 [Dentipellis sp. KUC8613]
MYGFPARPDAADAGGARARRQRGGVREGAGGGRGVDEGGREGAWEERCRARDRRFSEVRFYAEAGEQEYGTGNVVVDGAAGFQVTNVQVYNSYVLPTEHLNYGQLKIGDEVISSYDETRTPLPSFHSHPSLIHEKQLRRWPIQSNLTTTHIINFELREVLELHFDEMGSLVAPTKLYFDFSYTAQLTLAELAEVERISLDRVKRRVHCYFFLFVSLVGEMLDGNGGACSVCYPRWARAQGSAIVQYVDIVAISGAGHDFPIQG